MIHVMMGASVIGSYFEPAEADRVKRFYRKGGVVLTSKWEGRLS